MSEDDATKLSRRDMLKVGLVAGGAAMIGPGAVREVLAQSCPTDTAGQCLATTEVYPTSPLIGGKTVSVTKGKNTTFSVSRTIHNFDAFTEPLPVPTALRPEAPFSNPLAGTVNESRAVLPGELPLDTHQVGVDGQRVDCGPELQNYKGNKATPADTLANARFYRIRLEVGQHHFTNLKAVPINVAGAVVTPPTVTPGSDKRVDLPTSTIWGFNGQFPGPMINAEYDHPCLVRFENHLGTAPDPAPVADFGAPDRAFLTHLHNGHTAPESDGNPHHKPCAYKPGEWVENLYLNWPAGGDDREKQSFLWYHDHRMDHTGANVYKGLVGLYPIYDPDLDPGDESQGLGLPGKRTDNSDGSFNVKYDIPLAFYDCRLDDGVTPHQDFHQVGGCGAPRPDLYGRTFFKHFPDQGFVGDVFTVNGKACPVLDVTRRKYRFRFLDASISRQYEFRLMREQKDGTGKVLVGVAAAPGQQGQYNFVDLRGRNALGQQCMRFTQIASDGGLLPAPLVRDSIEIWPAKRREVIIDFAKYLDNTDTQPGDEVYLVNVAQMLDGRKRTERLDKGFDANYCVPVLKFKIVGNAPTGEEGPTTIPTLLRSPLPAWNLNVTNRVFKFNKQAVGGEIIWTINGRPFDPGINECDVTVGQPELWTFVNEGGGWTHPIHIHQEEHQIVSRNGQPAQGGDVAREDVVSLQGGESVTFYRNFRTFTGKYVVHCHNLAHEDHAMMFGWTIRANPSGNNNCPPNP